MTQRESRNLPVRARAERAAAESQAEIGRRRRDETARLASLERGVFAKHTLRPRLAARANTEKRRSGKRTVTTRARRRSR